MNIIFDQEIVLKKDIYSRMISLFKQAGWSDVSSKPSSDFNVLKSTGESNDKELCFQIRPTSRTNSGDVRTTSNIEYSVRLIQNYIPGSIGQSGTFSRPNEVWNGLRLFNTLANLEDRFTLYSHVNKDRGIFVFEHFTHKTPVEFVCLGLPHSYINEDKHSGVAIFTSYNNNADSAHIVNNTLKITSNPSSPYSSSYYLDIIAGAGTYNSGGSGVYTSTEGKHFLNKINYGDSREGIRGEIEGIYAIVSNANFISGDILKKDNVRFKLFNSNYSRSSLNFCGNFAIRVY